MRNFFLISGIFLIVVLGLALYWTQKFTGSETQPTNNLETIQTSEMASEVTSTTATDDSATTTPGSATKYLDESQEWISVLEELGAN